MNDPRRHRDSLGQHSIPVWLRALAAAVLLDPAALRRCPPITDTRPLPALQARRIPVGTRTRTSTTRALIAPAATTTPATTTPAATTPSAPKPSAPTVAEVAAAALIEGGHDDSAFLLLAVADTTPHGATRVHPGRTHTVRPRSTSRLLR